MSNDPDESAPEYRDPYRLVFRCPNPKCLHEQALTLFPHRRQATPHDQKVVIPLCEECGTETEPVSPLPD